MRRSVILAAALMGGLVASNSMAAFTFATSRTAVSATLDRVNLLVGSDQATISIAATAFDITAIGQANGLKFEVPGVGNPRVFAASDEASYTAAGNPPGTRLTYGGLPFGPTQIATPDPATGANKPLYQAGLPTINYVSFLLANSVNATADIGKYVIGSAVVPTGTAVSFVGNIQSDLNDAASGVAFSQTNGAVVSTNTNPVVVSPATQSVVFGSTVSAGKTFVSTVTVTDANAGDLLTLAAGTLPAGVSITSITPAAGGVSPQTFTVTGLLNYSTNMTTVTIPVVASDGAGGVGNGQIVLAVTPEPASLAALAGAAGLGLIRRRK